MFLLMKSTLPRILHIAPSNISNVPGTLVLQERAMGYDSRLLTLFANNRGYFEDICLHLPFIDYRGTVQIKKWVSSPRRMRLTNQQPQPQKIPIQWHPHTRWEKWFVALRDWLWSHRIRKAIEKYDLENFDVYQLDGGLGLSRNSTFELRMHQLGKKIICCYTGSDLRTRGVIPRIDKISQVNVTVEFDHLQLHPNIHHVFFPFHVEHFPRHIPNSELVRIGHAPTNWDAKGSHTIVPVLKNLQKNWPVEMVLIENMSHEQALAAKLGCDIFVDQIGSLGYGINSLESLAMGIVTCSCLAPGFAEKYPHHPFVIIDEDTIEEKLTDLIGAPEKRQQLGQRGREWVKTFHDAANTVKSIHQLAGIASI